jgi:hypothetical protein
MVYATNLTNAEHFRLNGTLPEDRIEELLTLDAQLQAVKGIDAHVEEAMTQYPAEDFLSGILSQLHALAKNVRGDNREKVVWIIEQLDDIAQCTFNAADYGRDELRQALKALEGASNEATTQ